MSETYEYLFKFLVIGSAGTGKSSLLNNFIGNKFKEDRCHTIGVEFGSKIVNIGGKSTKLQIWDTAGQERFRSVTRSYYRGAAGALLVYDITSRDSFNALANWLRDARTLASPNIVILLVGNKKDLEESREVTFTEASQFAQENDRVAVLCNSNRDKQTLEPCNHEEADTRIMAHVGDAAAAQGHTKIMVCTVNNDIVGKNYQFLLCHAIASLELMFLETSAKTGENVEEAFLKCSKTILAKIETGELDPERIGSGIQYGTSTSKRLAAPKKPARTPSECACRV